MLQEFLAAAGAVGFAVLFNVRGQKLFWIALGGAGGWGVYQLALQETKGVFSALLLATLAVALLSEGLARAKKAPVLLFLVPMLIPLIPGGDLYYAMESLVQGAQQTFWQRVQLVLLEAGAIALGILCVASGVNVVQQLLRNIKQQ